ncbi:MAG: amidohydrolase, partial [Candidatus Cloacimonetes bacterium]|nr:amidohydrolase [Candidatus Cloacimonadota bacterium]
MKKIDLLIKNGFVLDFSTKGSEFLPQDVVIDNGKIVHIGTSDDFLAEKIIRSTDKIVMPGFVNTHTHIPMSYFKGLADDLPLKEWLEKHIWPVETKFISPEFVYDAALFGCAELIKNGITTFNDMYFHEEKTAEAAKKIGIRAVIGEGITEFPVANHSGADDTLKYIRDLHQQYKNDNLIDIAVAPHAIYTCNKESLIKAKNLALELDINVHLHLSETEFEVKESLKKFGKRPVNYLDDFDFFQANVIAAHSLWLDKSEQEIFAKNNVSAAINASSNFKLASGINSFEPYLASGINLSIGTDSVSSNNNLSILSEINIISKVQKALAQNPAFLPAKQMIQMATINGAKALNKVNEIGSIEIGKKADIITVDINNFEAQPIYNIYSQLVYSLTSEQIKDVIIDGNIVMN